MPSRSTLAIVRHLDGDLAFDGDPTDLAGAAADGSRLFQLDAGETPATAGSLLAITGSLGGDTTPDRWTVQPYDYRTTIAPSLGIPLADSGVVSGDGNGDRIADVPVRLEHDAAVDARPPARHDHDLHDDDAVRRQQRARPRSATCS